MSREEAISEFKYALKLMIDLNKYNIIKERIICIYAIKGIDFFDPKISDDEIRCVTYSMLKLMTVIISATKNFHQLPEFQPISDLKSMLYSEYRTYYDKNAVDITKEVIALKAQAPKND